MVSSPFIPTPPSALDLGTYSFSSNALGTWFHLSQATRSDLRAISSLDSRARKSPSSLTARAEDSYRRTWQLRSNSRPRLDDSRDITVVALTDTAYTQLVGYARFLRVGAESSAQQDQSRWGLGMSWCPGWFSRTPPSPQTDTVPSKPNADRWHVQSLVLSPERKERRDGVAKALMEYVILQAKEDGVSVDVEATEDAVGFFRRLGFRCEPEVRALRVVNCDSGGGENGRVQMVFDGEEGDG